MAKVYHQVAIKIPKEYDDTQREAIASEIISFMRERTIKGRDVDGNKFPSYSKTYTRSTNFKAAGKSKSVDLTLSGDMLAYMELIRNKTGEIVVGFSDDSGQAGKAEGNIRGTYGQASPIKGKARPFLGINKEDLQKILEKYPTESPEDAQARAEAVLAAQERIDKYTDKVKQKGEDENVDQKTLVKRYRIQVG